MPRADTRTATSLPTGPGFRRPAILRRFVSGVSLLLALVGCAPPGGEGSLECTPSPTITSTPPTVATVGQVYAYHATGYFNCFLTICFGIEGERLPPGATVSSPNLTWTPAADQAGHSYSFRIRTEADACGDTVSQGWTVEVYPAPEVVSFLADPAAVKPGEATRLTAVFSGGSGEIGGLGPVVSGVPVAIPPLFASTAFTLTVTNPAGGSVSRTLEVAVFESPPSIATFAPDAPVVTRGGGTILRWQASDFGFLTLDPGGVDVTGSTWAEVYPDVDTEYTLTASNAAWGARTASTGVRVVPPPSIASFSASPAQTGFLGQVELTAAFEGGEGWIEGLGAVAPGVPVSSGPLEASTVFRLVVTNEAGAEATRELLVPITGPGTWSAAKGNPVVLGRYRHTATLLADGRVLLAGGYGLQPGDSFTTEFFDPATETFSPGPLLRTARVDHVAVLLQDGRVLVVGGSSEDARQSAELFDPQTNAFASTGSPAYGWYEAAARLPGGDVLVLPNQVGQSAQRFDPSRGAFSSAGPLLAFHGHLQPVPLLDGSLLIVDGNDHLWCELYDPVGGGFSQTGTVRRWRPNFAAAPLPDGRVLVAGDVPPGTPAEVYDPVTGLFSDAGGEVGVGSYPRAAALQDGRVLVVGGQAAELFEPPTGTFRPTGGLLATHGQPTLTRLPDGRVLVVGGSAAAPELYTP